MPEPAVPQVDITQVKFVFSLKMIVVTIATIFTLMGSGYAAYYGITGRIKSVDDALAAQTQVISSQTTEIKTLKDTNTALEHRLFELTVTLKANGVIK